MKHKNCDDCAGAAKERNASSISNTMSFYDNNFGWLIVALVALKLPGAPYWILAKTALALICSLNHYFVRLVLTLLQVKHSGCHYWAEIHEVNKSPLVQHCWYTRETTQTPASLKQFLQRFINTKQQSRKVTLNTDFSMKKHPRGLKAKNTL